MQLNCLQTTSHILAYPCHQARCLRNRALRKWRKITISMHCACSDGRIDQNVASSSLQGHNCPKVADGFRCLTNVSTRFNEKGLKHPPSTHTCASCSSFGPQPSSTGSTLLGSPRCCSNELWPLAGGLACGLTATVANLNPNLHHPEIRQRVKPD